MEIKVKDKNETKLLAEVFAFNIKEKGGFISLLGDIGAGKTEFTRFVIKALGVQENVTSPSFVILNEYRSKYFPIYHFDLYRLETTGVDSIKEELREYSKENVLTFVEWANFGTSELPYDRLEIKVKYDVQNYSTERIFEFTGSNEYYNNLIEKVSSDFNSRIKN